MLVTAPRGYTLIEVLIALVLVSISLLGLAGLQLKSQQTQIETFQRSQAMLLLNDITSRINLNREGNVRRCYVTEDANNTSYSVGTGADTFPPCIDFGGNGSRAIADQDILQWDRLLDGASESLAGSNVGGLIGARGCISFNPVNNSIQVVVAWQGEVATAAPAEACGQGLYGDEKLRRTVSKTIDFAELG